MVKDMLKDKFRSLNDYVKIINKECDIRHFFVNMYGYDEKGECYIFYYKNWILELYFTQCEEVVEFNFQYSLDAFYELVLNVEYDEELYDTLSNFLIMNIDSEEFIKVIRDHPERDIRKC